MKGKKWILLCITTILVISFLVLQLFLSAKLTMDLHPSEPVSTIIEEGTPIPPEEEEEEIIQPEEIIHQEVFNETTTQSPEKKDVVFNPIGIPFLTKKWWSLYQYYLSMKEKESINNTHSFRKDILHSMNNTLPYQLIQNSFFDILFIDKGCVDVYKRSIIIVDPRNQTTQKSYLRSNLFTVKREDLYFPGFDSYSISRAFGEIPSVTPMIHSNLTWILATPQEVDDNDECSQSFHHYIPLFYQSIYSILPSSVLSSFSSSLLA